MDEKERLGQNQDADRFSRLLARHVRGKLGDAERVELERWLAADIRRMELFNMLSNGSTLSEALSTFAQPDTDAALQQLRGKLADTRRSPRSKTKRLRKWMPYAAAVLIAAVAMTWIFVDNQTPPKPAVVSRPADDVPPGGNRATLTLTDGRTITLDEVRDGIVIGSGEITYNDGNPLAEVDGNDDGQEEIPLLELTTPKGGTYQVTLPDDTRVWLNAASTLKYPSRFDGEERVVELSGEAYFAVAKEVKKPFKVISNGQKIQVLGTEFNVSAYVDEAETKTTLVEGAVQIFNYQSSIVNRLKPGEQSIIRGASTDIQKVDTERYTAWKNGYFYFKHTPFEEIMRRLARWYNVEVVYKGSIPQETFSGEMDRNLTLNGALKLLNVLSVQVQIEEGDKLIVY